MAIRGKGIKSSAQDNFIAPDAPTGVSATDVGTSRAFNNGAATVTFSAPTTGNTVGITSYTATSSPGGYTASGASSPLTVTGLQSNTAYTFTVTATNAYGTSSASTASASMTATTVPATPSAPTVSSVANQSTDIVSWTAPSTGGKALSTYYWTSSDGKSGNVAAPTTSVNVAQEAGTAQTYNVYVTNANGSSGTSANSSSFTSFSFSPFGFTPFGFTPFGFTPFGFTPFGFTPFGFTPFGFSPFAWFNGGNSLAPEISISVINEENNETTLLDISTIESGSLISSFNFDTFEKSNTIITSVSKTEDDRAILIDGDIYTYNHKMYVRKNGIESFINVKDLDTTYEKYSTYLNDFVEIFSVEDIEVPVTAVSLQCQPNNYYLANNVILSD